MYHYNTCTPASLSALDVALDGTVSVVWGTCEVGHVQWLAVVLTPAPPPPGYASTGNWIGISQWIGVWGWTCVMAGSGTDSCSFPSRVCQYRNLDRRPTVNWWQDTTPSSWYCLWEIYNPLPWAMANYLVISYTPTVVDDCLWPMVICTYVCTIMGYNG